MRPHIHFDKHKTASYAADKSTIRTILCLAETNGYPLSHLVISSAFTAEPYDFDKPILVHQMPRFDGTMKQRNKPHGRFILNLYG